MTRRALRLSRMYEGKTRKRASVFPLRRPWSTLSKCKVIYLCYAHRVDAPLRLSLLGGIRTCLRSVYYVPLSFFLYVVASLYRFPHRVSFRVAPGLCRIPKVLDFLLSLSVVWRETFRDQTGRRLRNRRTTLDFEGKVLAG